MLGHVKPVDLDRHKIHDYDDYNDDDDDDERSVCDEKRANLYQAQILPCFLTTGLAWHTTLPCTATSSRKNKNQLWRRDFTFTHFLAFFIA